MSIKSKLLKGGAVFGAVAIFATAGVLFDNFVRAAATQMLQITIADISKGAEMAVLDATNTLDEVMANNALICTPGFIDGVRQTMQRSIYVRQILVENNYGARYCSGLEVDFNYLVLSDELPIPGRDETLAAIRPAGSETSLLRITHKVDDNRTISAFVHFAPILATGQLPGIASWGDVLRVEFTNGVSLLSRGEQGDFDFDRPQRSHIFASVLAGEFPIRVMGSVPIEVVRTQYLNMYFGVLGIALFLAGGALVVVWRRIDQAVAGIANLERAIRGGEIVPYYQPVIDVSVGTISGGAMVARWEKSDGKILPADVFVPYAQATNLMDALLICLIKQAASDIVTITHMHPEVRIGVGLGEIRFYNEVFVRKILNVLSKHKLAPEKFEFEISAFPKLGRKSSGRKAIARLRKAGFGVTLVGATPRQIDLKYAQALGVETVRVEGEFSVGLEKLVENAKTVGIDVSALGVETRVQLGELKQAKVNLVQGELIAPALKIERFFEMLALMNGDGQSEKTTGSDDAGTSLAAENDEKSQSAA